MKNHTTEALEARINYLDQMVDADPRLSQNPLVVRQRAGLQAQLERSREPALSQRQGPFHPPEFEGYQQPFLAPDRWITVPNIPAITPSTGPSAQVTLRFQSGPGLLIGMRGSVTDFTAGAFRCDDLTAASIAVQINLNGNENLVINGVAADFARYLDLFPAVMPYAPLFRMMEADDTMNFQWQNSQPTVANGGHILQPSLQFAFWGLRQS